MNPVIEAFRRIIPVRHRLTGRGWITFNCPACGDRKGRGAFRITETGGFRYNCKNGGCEYETNTGWEPDNGFFGRPRRFFESLGGSISDIPVQILIQHRSDHADCSEVQKYDPSSGRSYAEWLMDDETAVRLHPPEETAKEFPELSLPQGSELLLYQQQPSEIKDKRDCQTYVLKRGVFFWDYPFLWTPLYPRYVICPFVHRGKVIGWIGRNIDPVKQPHLKCPKFPTDYMLNQGHAFRNGMVLVQEGTFDAVALNSLCTFGNTISKKQINFLNQVKASGRRVVLLPDHQGGEWMPYWNAAKENGWYLSVPAYPGSGSGPEQHIKDVGDSIRRNGLMLTVEAIVGGIKNNYLEAQVELLSRSKG